MNLLFTPNILYYCDVSTPVFMNGSQPLTATQIPYAVADLLKPIKDLAQVWQIDIEPYIDQFVVQITNQLIQNVDFREAALIIQQTSQLFAKKVDFLFDFVNQILLTQPGKQKRRRTTHQQSQDLVLNYDDEPDDQLNNFFDFYQQKNQKVVQTANLYLLPKNPFTMLSARYVIENNDVRITPLMNAIHQNQTFLLEQWNPNDLQAVLTGNQNL